MTEKEKEFHNLIADQLEGADAMAKAMFS